MQVKTCKVFGKEGPGSKFSRKTSILPAFLEIPCLHSEARDSLGVDCRETARS